MGLNKEELRKRFSSEWKKHYKTDFLEEKGFSRKKCKKCGKHFWALETEKEVCADSSCSGFDFIGKKTKAYSYVQTWKAIEKYFEKKGHKSISRYPVVARWRDDLFFVNASIIDFQPYVVSGELEPIANPLIVPQPCLRFKDLQNVGVTGQHFSAFIMFGQHAFNSKKTGLFYWKNEALEHDFNYLTKVIGVKEKELVFAEDVWAGGGTFGPSMEYLANGVELGNCVFMQFKETEKGAEELKTKVIDMGAGLERLAWYSNGTPTSYDVVFREVLKKAVKDAGLSNAKNFSEFFKASGLLDAETKGIEQKRKDLMKKTGVSEKEYFEEIRPLQALYACADHLKAMLYAVNDGMLPSNSGGGYNIRMLIRRVFAFNEEFGLNLDVPKIIEIHAKSLKELDKTLVKGVRPAMEIALEEQKKEARLREKAGQKIALIVEKAGKGKMPREKELEILYESQGIAPELIERQALKKGIKIRVPENFYARIAEKNEKEKSKQKKSVLAKSYPKTQELFFKEPLKESFKAKVLGIEGNNIILDKTAFFAESGGQAHDLGTLNKIKIERVEKHEGIVMHKVKEKEKFRKGMLVKGKIDLGRRKQLMRHHTATHLLKASCVQILGNHVWQAGAQKEIEKAHLDLTHYKRITRGQLRELEKKVNELILADIQVNTFFMPRNQAEQKYSFSLYQGGYVPGKTLRIVEVPGIDVQACGGTHAQSTGQIGFFKILKREGVQDGVERIVFACGLNALKKVQEKEKLLEETAESFSVPVKELPNAGNRIFSEWKELRKKLDKANQGIAVLAAEKIIKSKEKKQRILFENMETKQLIEIGNVVTAKRKDIVLAMASGQSIVVFCGESSGESAGEKLKEFLLLTNGRGGGSKKMAVGTADADKIKAVFKRND